MARDAMFQQAHKICRSTAVVRKVLAALLACQRFMDAAKLLLTIQKAHRRQVLCALMACFVPSASDELRAAVRQAIFSPGPEYKAQSP